MRVFDDGGTYANLWYELEPDKFWCGYDQADAADTRRRLPSLGQSAERLHVRWPNLREVFP